MMAARNLFLCAEVGGPENLFAPLLAVHQTAQMDRYDGPARLEWWANRSTCLYSAEVSLAVIVEDGTWHACAELTAPLTGEDREGWLFLARLSPCFTLAFPGEQTARVEVLVQEAGDGRLTLTAPSRLPLPELTHAAPVGSKRAEAAAQ